MYLLSILYRRSRNKHYQKKLTYYVDMAHTNILEFPHMYETQTKKKYESFITIFNGHREHKQDITARKDERKELKKF